MQTSELFLTATALMIQQAESVGDFNSSGVLQQMNRLFYTLPQGVQNLVIAPNMLTTGAAMRVASFFARPDTTAQLEAQVSGSGAASVQQQKVQDFLTSIASDPEVRQAHLAAEEESRKLGVAHAEEVAAQLASGKPAPDMVEPPMSEEYKQAIMDAVRAALASAKDAMASILPPQHEEPAPVEQSASGAVEVEAQV